MVFPRSSLRCVNVVARVMVGRMDVVARVRTTCAAAGEAVNAAAGEGGSEGGGGGGGGGGSESDRPMGGVLVLALAVAPSIEVRERFH